VKILDLPVLWFHSTEFSCIKLLISRLINELFRVKTLNFLVSFHKNLDSTLVLPIIPLNREVRFLSFPHLLSLRKLYFSGAHLCFLLQHSSSRILIHQLIDELQLKASFFRTVMSRKASKVQLSYYYGDPRLPRR